MNSLKAQQEKNDTIAGKLILEWKTPQNSDKVLLLVEGPGDVNFYHPFFNESTCRIRLGGGCTNLNKINQVISRYRSVIKRHIIIRDSDFSRVNGSMLSDGYVFYADAHDHEMMCIKDANVLTRTASKCGLLNHMSIYDDITQELKTLSYFKWYNYTLNKKYDFKHIDIVNISEANLNDINYLFSCIPNKDPNIDCAIVFDDFHEFSALRASVDLSEVTNGHDFIKRFITHLRKIEHKQIAEKKFLKYLHEEYGMDEFAQSDLYSNIHGWEVNNSVVILKRQIPSPLGEG